MPDTLNSDEVATVGQGLRAAGTHELDLAAQQVEHLASAMRTHLADGGAACATLTLTVALGENLPLESLSAALRQLGIRVVLETDVSDQSTTPHQDAAERSDDPPVSAIPPLRKPVAMRTAGARTSSNDADDAEPVGWVFTSQGGGKAVRV